MPPQKTAKQRRIDALKDIARGKGHLSSCLRNDIDWSEVMPELIRMGCYEQGEAEINRAKLAKIFGLA